jgi:hypothetical protein
MFTKILSLIPGMNRPAPAAQDMELADEMADEIGFHAIWDRRCHGVRPTTWCAGNDVATDRPDDTDIYAGRVS